MLCLDSPLLLPPRLVSPPPHPPTSSRSARTFFLRGRVCVCVCVVGSSSASLLASPPNGVEGDPVGLPRRRRAPPLPGAVSEPRAGPACSSPQPQPRGRGGKIHRAAASRGGGSPPRTVSPRPPVEGSVENGAPTTQSPAPLADPADNGTVQILSSGTARLGTL